MRVEKAFWIDLFFLPSLFIALLSVNPKLLAQRALSTGSGCPKE
jgi:hypothetical protein